MFGQQLTVDINLIIAKLNRFARQPDHSFDVIYLIRNDSSESVSARIFSKTGIFENYNVAAPYFALRQKRNRFAAGRKDEFVNQQIIADQNRILHRTGRNRYGLQNKRHPENRHNQGHDKRFEILSKSAFRRSGRFFVGFYFNRFFIITHSLIKKFNS